MIDHDSRRVARLRDEAMRARPPGAAAPASGGTPRFIGQVTAGAAMPSSTGKVFLVHPVVPDGPEREGSPVTFTVDSSRTIPVVMIGSRTPVVGDFVAAFSIGGRWVANAGALTNVSCLPCPLPRKNLVLSWINSLSGNGATPLIYTAPSSWTSACVQQMVYSLTCAGSQIQFGVTSYPSGSCSSGPTQTCVSPGKNPSALLLDSTSCSPLFLHYSVTTASCSSLWSKGYTAFTITQ